MLSTANLSRNIQDVPSSWIFQNYCHVNEHLAGQEMKITSVFKPTERTPSMVLYWDASNRYKFNDFSTGKKGDGIDLVKYLFNLDNKQSTIKILNDYQNYISGNGKFSTGLQRISAKYKVSAHETRMWNTDDVRFWTAFNIGSRMLEHYRVKPLAGYVMTKQDDNSQISINKPYCYGYFKKDGTLYKIYQPYNKERKFIKVISGYVQGSEQRGKNNSYLLLTSSLKDSMSIRSLGIKRMDFESPDSENTGFDPLYIEKRMSEYKQILTLFDNDSTGIEAMRKYKQQYGFNFVFFNLAKDPADGIKKLGPKPVRDDLVIKINSQLLPLM